jgi:hypothetical protein
MPSKHIAIFRNGREKQRGAFLLVILVIIMVGAAAFLLNRLNNSSLQAQRNKVTADALAQAKDALIAYAVTYSDTHPGYAYGYLPCPDSNASNGEGSSTFNCSSHDVSAIGRLPWRTLDLPPLRDGNGECLWYAVSGNYKNSFYPTYTLMNWDNYGFFQIYAAPTNVPLTGSTQDTYAVAVVFSPGVALSGQNRSDPSTPPVAPVCGGNYTTSNYLDHDTINSVTYNNATPSATANAISTFINAGASANFNDQIIYITSSDIFNAVKKRNDFGTFVSSMLSVAKTNLENAGSLPTPVIMNFSNSAAVGQTNNTSNNGYMAIGKIPKSYLGAQYQNWQDNIQYGQCLSHNCLTVNNGPGCDGIIIFAGERIATGPGTQTRTSLPSSTRNTQSNYLEGLTVLNKYSNLTSPYNFTGPGPASYSPTSTSTDLLVCIQ